MKMKKILKYKTRMNFLHNTPFLDGIIVNINPHLNIRIGGKYKHDGARLFGSIKKTTRNMLNDKNEVMLKKGEKYLWVHVHGQNPKNIIQAINEAKKLI